MQYLDVGVGYAEPCRRVLQRQPLAVPQDDQGAQTFVQPVQGFTERLKGFPLQQAIVYAGSRVERSSRLSWPAAIWRWVSAS